MPASLRGPRTGGAYHPPWTASGQSPSAHPGGQHACARAAGCGHGRLAPCDGGASAPCPWRLPCCHDSRRRQWQWPPGWRPTVGSKGNHEHGHVPCPALPETGDLAAGLGRRALGCRLVDLYQVLPEATRSTRGSRTGGNFGCGCDAYVNIQAIGQDIHAGFFRGRGDNEHALASQELVQRPLRTGVSTSPLAQRQLYQGVEEPSPSLGPPRPADTTPDLHGP